MNAPVIENCHHHGAEFLESVMPHSIEQFRPGHVTNADALDFLLLLGGEIERVAQKGIGLPLLTWVGGND